jgi:hypothetical protein
MVVLLMLESKTMPHHSVKRTLFFILLVPTFLLIIILGIAVKVIPYWLAIHLG